MKAERQRTRILNNPNELNVLNPTLPPQITPQQLLNHTQPKRNPAASNDKQCPRKTRKDSSRRPSKRSLNPQLELSLSLDILAKLFRQMNELSRPISRVLAKENKAIIRPTSASYREWVRFGPAEHAHAARKYTQTDVLTSTPPRVDGWDLDIGNVKLRDVGDRSSCDAGLDKTHDSVNTIESDTGDRIWLQSRTVEAGLSKQRVSCQHSGNKRKAKDRYTYRREQHNYGDGVGPEEDIVKLLPPETGREEPQHVHANHEDHPPSILRSSNIFRKSSRIRPFEDCEASSGHC